MAFYVPLGPRGLLLRAGTFLIGVVGGLAYWRASRRRASSVPLVRLPVLVPELPAGL